MNRKARSARAAAERAKAEDLQNCQRAVRVELGPLQRFLVRVRRQVGLPKHAVGIRLIPDTEMARLNQKYRGKKGSTDVLSFPAEPRTGPLRLGRGTSRGAYLGDIAISPETARRNALALGRELPQELQILILHGVLHLLGYDHETDHGEMERREHRLRRRFGLV